MHPIQAKLQDSYIKPTQTDNTRKLHIISVHTQSDNYIMRLILF